MKNIKYLNAGAGSGKTYFLTSTLADLVKKGQCAPTEVIMTTFSEKAADDIKRNTRERFLKDGLFREATELDAAHIGTVHAVAHSFVRKYWYLLGISAQCEVMTDDNKEAYIALTLGNATTPDDIAAFSSFVESVGLTLSQSTHFDYDFWKGDVSEIISKADSMGIDDLTESHQLSLARIDATCQALPAYQSIRDCADRIFQIARRWRSGFRQYKKDNSIIDYNDMENYFLTLLKDPRYEEVQQEIRDSIKYVFVDEFQDSNPKQLEIFDRLSDLVVKSFWVGDPKQSIYGFRASDTALVQALTDHIRQKEAAGISGFETDRLDVSRRSLKPLVEFTNNVFPRLFPNLKVDDVVLKPTHRLVTFPGNVPLIQHWDAALKPGKVKKNGKVGTPGIPNKEDAQNDLASELRRILDGQSNIKQVYDKDLKDPVTGGPLLRDIRPSDIAILCRTNNDISPVAQALSRYGIPVVIKETADAGKLEVRLVLLMLNYILGDEKLLTAELSKLLCGLTLSDILEKDYATIEQLTAYLKEYRERLSGKGVASIVRGIIIGMNLLDCCAKWGSAESRRNNLMALMQNARDYEANCLTLGESATVEGFIAQIESGKIKVEGYASDGVNILTYHGSKGLQWPMVILYSLTNDLLTEKQVSKSYMWNVIPVRKGVPTATNLYPGYYITYSPRLTNVYSSGLDDSVMAEITMQSGPGSYREFYSAQIEEGRRLLYVGVTRARDLLVEMGLHGKGCTFLTDVLRGISPDPKWEVKTPKDLPSDTFQEIWGPGTPPFFYREIDAQAPPVTSLSTTYPCLPKVAPCSITDAKRISPSTLSDDALVKAVRVVCLNDDGKAFPQLIIKGANAKDDEVGTCIHNIFATYDPALEPSSASALAASTIARHCLQAALTSPDAIIGSIKGLYDILEKTYGKAVTIEHELPFRELRGGQMTVGSIDLVWFTGGDECVLVDFKNLPFADRAVLDPLNSRYIGHYAPQQKAYKEALERSGIRVKACIIYLSMQGKVISLEQL